MTTGDRYNNVNPLDPGVRIEERFRNIEQRLHGVENRTLQHSVLPQGSIRILDAAQADAVTMDQDGITVAEGKITVDGGPVRALDLSFDEGTAQNVSLTTTLAEFAVVTITPPDWADRVVVQAFCLFQMSNSSGGVQGMQYRAMVNGIPSSGAWTTDVASGGIANATDYYQRTLVRGTDFTTTVEASAGMGVSVGTNSANVIRTKATAYYLR